MPNEIVIEKEEIATKDFMIHEENTEDKEESKKEQKKINHQKKKRTFTTGYFK